MGAKGKGTEKVGGNFGKGEEDRRPKDRRPEDRRPEDRRPKDRRPTRQLKIQPPSGGRRVEQATGETLSSEANWREAGEYGKQLRKEPSCYRDGVFVFEKRQRKTNYVKIGQCLARHVLLDR